MAVGGKRNRLVFGLGVMLAMAGILFSGNIARADFTDGVVAWSRISPQAGIRIWRKAAWRDDDFLSEIKLGDVYGDERGGSKYYDPVESYVWYYLASISARVGENISDRYARRAISNNFHRALAQQQKFMLLMTAAQREDARNRIIYILSCRGADGFIKLGQIHATNAGYDDGRWRDYGDSADTYRGLGGVWNSQYNFRRNARGEFNRGDVADARRMMGIPNDSVIVPNDGEALMYFHIAANMGHPLANEYLRGLDPAVRGSRWLGPRISQEANEKAHYWAPPYEYYPLGITTAAFPIATSATSISTGKRRWQRFPRRFRPGPPRKHCGSSAGAQRRGPVSWRGPVRSISARCSVSRRLSATSRAGVSTMGKRCSPSRWRRARAMPHRRTRSA
jgi:hypothetical protein